MLAPRRVAQDAGSTVAAPGPPEHQGLWGPDVTWSMVPAEPLGEQTLGEPQVAGSKERARAPALKTLVLRPLAPSPGQGGWGHQDSPHLLQAAPQCLPAPHQLCDVSTTSARD